MGAGAGRFAGERIVADITLEPYGSIFVDFGTSTARPQPTPAGGANVDLQPLPPGLLGPVTSTILNNGTSHSRKRHE